MLNRPRIKKVSTTSCRVATASPAAPRADTPLLLEVFVAKWLQSIDSWPTQGCRCHKIPKWWAEDPPVIRGHLCRPFEIRCWHSHAEAQPWWKIWTSQGSLQELVPLAVVLQNISGDVEPPPRLPRLPRWWLKPWHPNPRFPEHVKSQSKAISSDWKQSCHRYVNERLEV